MDLLENNIEKHIQRIEHGLHVDLTDIHHVFYNEIDIKGTIFGEFDYFGCSSSIFWHELLV